MIPRSQRRRRDLGGFSLIELLVVVAIGDGHVETLTAEKINPAWKNFSIPAGWGSLPNGQNGIYWYFGGYQDITFTS